MAQAKNVFLKQREEEAVEEKVEVKDIQVVATRDGYYAGRRKFAGDVFTIKSDLFSKNWMEKIVVESK